jgi:phosphoribosylformylglycinamidine synthase
MEACLELLQTDLVTDLHDVRAAGLAGCAVRLATRGRGGIELDVLKIPRPEGRASPLDVALSEFPECALVIVRKRREEEVKAILARWGLCSAIIGSTTGDGLIRIREGETIVAEIPASVLVEPPPYMWETAVPTWLERLQGYRLDRLPDIMDHELYPRQFSNWRGAVPSSQAANKYLLALLASPNVASKERVFPQYESFATDAVAVPSGARAAVMHIKGTTKAIALSVSGGGRLCCLDCFVGGAAAVAEAARNVVCAGAEPVAAAVFLNLSGLGRMDMHYQAEQLAQGMAEACVQLNIPVISADADFRKVADQEIAYPSPVVSVLGLIEDAGARCNVAFRDEGDLVVLLGGRRRRKVGAGDDERAEAAALSGSEFLALVHGLVVGRPEIDLDLEARTQRCCLAAIRQGLIKSAQGCSGGGLAVCLAKSCIAGRKGFRDWAFAAEDRSDTALFGEQPSRIVVSLSPSKLPRLLDLAKRENVPVQKLGVVTGDRLVISGYLDLSVSQMEETWQGALRKELVGS